MASASSASAMTGAMSSIKRLFFMVDFVDALFAEVLGVGAALDVQY